MNKILSQNYIILGKVAIGIARYLLNIVYLTLGCSNHLFSVAPNTVNSLTVNLGFIFNF